MQQLKVIPYTRVGNSKAVGTPEGSIEGQKQALLKYCTENNLNPVAIFSDIASASSFDRPGFKEMLAFIGNNELGIRQIIVTYCNKFSRNMAETYNMEEQLKKLGIEVVAINKPQLSETFLSNVITAFSSEFAYPEFKIHKDNMPEFASIIGETDLEYSIDSNGDDYILIEVTYNTLDEYETHIIKRLTAIEEKQGTAHEIVDARSNNPLILNDNEKGNIV